jgi:hypothetical protein
MRAPHWRKLEVQPRCKLELARSVGQECVLGRNAERARSDIRGVGPVVRMVEDIEALTHKANLVLLVDREGLL